MEISPIWNVFFIAAFSQGFFIAIILFIQFYKTRFPSQFYLGVFVFCFSYILVNNCVYWNGLFELYPHFLFTTLPVRYLLAPLFLFYCYAFIEKKTSKWELLHFLPAFLLLLVYLPYILLSGPGKIEILLMPTDANNAVIRTFGNLVFSGQSLQLLIYSLLTFKALHSYTIHYEAAMDPKKVNQLNWLKLFNGLFFLYGLMMLLYFILIAVDVGGMKKDYVISLVICLAIYCISFIGMFNPELLHGERFMEQISKLKYKRTRLKPSYLRETIRRLEQLMQRDRLYLDATINLNVVATKMNIPRHHISQALSLEKGKTFNEFINYYRVKHAQTLLDNISGGDNIKTIMHSSGFNNRVSFNNNFKKMIGMTATEYIKSPKK